VFGGTKEVSVCSDIGFDHTIEFADLWRRLQYTRTENERLAVATAEVGLA
jgi:hypothetical protein